nr:immunoglobulin light chain junction region [Macaca mulatta]
DYYCQSHDSILSGVFF